MLIDPHNVGVLPTSRQIRTRSFTESVVFGLLVR